MKIDAKKTKIMRVCRNGSKREKGNAINTILDGKVVKQDIQQVKQFRYLESLISDDGACTAEINCRIAMLKNALNKRREFFLKKVGKDLKKIMKT